MIFSLEEWKTAIANKQAYTNFYALNNVTKNNFSLPKVIKTIEHVSKDVTLNKDFEIENPEFNVPKGFTNLVFSGDFSNVRYIYHIVGGIIIDRLYLDNEKKKMKEIKWHGKYVYCMPFLHYHWNSFEFCFDDKDQHTINVSYDIVEIDSIVQRYVYPTREMEYGIDNCTRYHLDSSDCLAGISVKILCEEQPEEVFVEFRYYDGQSVADFLEVEDKLREEQAVYAISDIEFKDNFPNEYKKRSINDLFGLVEPEQPQKINNQKICKSMHCSIPLTYKDGYWRVQFAEFDENGQVTNYAECPHLELPSAMNIMAYHTEKTGMIKTSGGKSVGIGEIYIDSLKKVEIRYGLMRCH